jgi:hypothetical protein
MGYLVWRKRNCCVRAVTAQKGYMYVNQHHNPFDRLADDRPVAAMPPHPAEGVGAEGVSKVCRVPAAGLRAGDLKCTGCGPSAAGRATTGSKVRYKRMTCLKPLYLQLNSRSPDGVGRSRCEPVGLLRCLLVNACKASVCGSSFLARTPEPQGVKRRTYGSKVDRRNTGTTSSACCGAGYPRRPGMGAGGAEPRSSPRTGKPSTWRRRAGSRWLS